MTNTQPQAALLSEAAKNALVTLDGIADTNPRDTADFETPSEWITWAKSRARWAADALRTPVSQEIYAERILKQMMHEAVQDSHDKECSTCGFIGQEDPVKGCPKCGFDDMRAKLQAATPASEGQLLRDKVADAIARAWSHPGNAGNSLDASTANSIIDHVCAALSARGQAKGESA